MQLEREGAILVLLETEKLEMEGSSTFSVYLEDLIIPLVLKQGRTLSPFYLSPLAYIWNEGLAPCQILRGEMNRWDFPSALN